MSDYSSLKATINANVKANNNHEITGSIMNSVLNAMVSSLGKMYQMVGVATPDTNPGTPDYNVAYIATPGEYPYFGNLVVPNGYIALFVYAGTWAIQTLAIPTTQQVAYLSNKDIYPFFRVGYLGVDGNWASVSSVHSIDKLYVSPSDVIILSGVSDITGMGFCVRGVKKDGTLFQYEYNSSRVVSLGGGKWEIIIPDDVSSIDYITISWLATQQGVSVQKGDTDLFVKTRGQILTPTEQDFLVGNLGLDKTDFIVDNDLVRKNTDKIVVGAYIDNTTGQEIPDATASYIKIPITAETQRIMFVVFDTSFSNTYGSYAFFDSSDTFLGGAIDNQNVPNKVGINNIKVRENTAYILVNFESTHGIGKFRIFEAADFYNIDFLVGGVRVNEITNAEIINSTFWDLLTRGVDRNGDALSYPDIGTTRMIACKEGEKFRISNWLSTLTPSAFGYTYVFFDSSLTAISYGQGYTTEYDVTIPENVKYVAFLYETGASISVKKIACAGDVKILPEALPNYEGNHNWDGKIWVGLGDSLTAQSPSYVGLSWSPLVEEKTGLVFKNCGIGSTCLAGNGADAFWKRLSPVEAYNPDLVTILGGANDLFSDIPLGTEAEFDKPIADKDCMTFMGAYSYIIETLLTWKKSLRIVVMSTAYAHSNGAEHTPGIGLTYEDYSEACKKVAHYYGLPVVDLYDNMGLNKITQDTTYTRGDHIHWNAAGSQIVASLLISKLNEINNA